MHSDDRFNPWAHYNNEAQLYAARARRDSEQLTCHRQVARVLAPLISPGDSVMDVGCASGYTYWSFHDLGLAIDYHGLDPTARFIDLGRDLFCPLSGVSPEHLQVGAVETLTGTYDFVIAVNTLYCLPNFHQAVERMCAAAKKALFIRTLLAEKAEYRYLVTDYPDMDPEYRLLKAYYNIYALDEVMAAIREGGLQPRMIVDERTGDTAEVHRGIRYPWRCILAVRP